MTGNTMPSHEATPLPPTAFFSPGELMDMVHKAIVGDATFKEPNVVTGIALKVESGCNLLCQKADDGTGYDCYMDYKNDDWKRGPRRMLDEVTDATGRQIGLHAIKHGLEHFNVIIHGGEPLLRPNAGAVQSAQIKRLEEAVKSTGSEVELHYAMQSNAYKIPPDAPGMIAEHNVRTSFSVDGGREAHDRSRRTKDGKSTYDAVDANIRYMVSPESGCADKIAGLIAVINVHNDPNAVWDALCSYDMSGAPQGWNVVFSLPYDANHDNLPDRVQGDPSPTPYADWLLTIFHLWDNDIKAGKVVPEITLFRSIINLAHGAPSQTEAIGPYPSGVVFLRPDGTSDEHDSQNIISRQRNLLQIGNRKDGEPLNIQHNSLDDFGEVLRKNEMLGRKKLAAACMSCVVVDICHNGQKVNRYSKEGDPARGLNPGYDNVTVFCEDLKKLTREIISITNAEYMEVVAADKVAEFYNTYGAVPLKNYPFHKAPRPTKRSLAQHIRPAEPSDLVQITELQAAAIAYDYAQVVPKDDLQRFISDGFESRKYHYWRKWLEEAQYTDGRLIVAMLGSQILGFAALKLTQKDTAHLDAMYESPQAAGGYYGVAEVLIRQAKHALQVPITAQSIANTTQATVLLDNGFRPAPLLGMPQPAVINGHTLPAQPLELPVALF